MDTCVCVRVCVYVCVCHTYHVWRWQFPEQQFNHVWRSAPHTHTLIIPGPAIVWGTIPV